MTRTFTPKQRKFQEIKLTNFKSMEFLFARLEDHAQIIDNHKREIVSLELEVKRLLQARMDGEQCDEIQLRAASARIVRANACILDHALRALKDRESFERTAEKYRIASRDAAEETAKIIIKSFRTSIERLTDESGRR